MNQILHGRKLIAHPAIWASALFLAVLQPLAFAAPPGGVTLNTPNQGATVNSPAAVEFTWSQSDPAATWYQLYVARDGATQFNQWVPTNHLTAVNGLPGGNYSWWVRTWNPDGLGPWTGPATFSVVGGVPGQVTLISPLDTVVNSSTVDFTWTADPSATWYHLYVNKDNSLFANRWFGPFDLAFSGNNVVGTLSNLTSGTYTWWVMPWGPDGFGTWSDKGTFTVLNQGEPGQVTLISPGNGSTAPTRTVLEWSTPSPAADWFNVLVHRNNAPFFERWVQQTNALTFGNGLPAGDYAWWVRPWSSNGLGIWSSTSTFSVVGGAPTNTILVSPIGNVAVTGSDVDYTWTADPNATWYELFINQNNQPFFNRWFNVSQLNLVNGVNFRTTVPNHSTGNYTWWARAWGPDGLGPWSEMGSFVRTTQ